MSNVTKFDVYINTAVFNTICAIAPAGHPTKFNKNIKKETIVVTGDAWLVDEFNDYNGVKVEYWDGNAIGEDTGKTYILSWGIEVPVSDEGVPGEPDTYDWAAPYTCRYAD